LALQLIIALVVSFVAALLFTQLVRLAAWRFDFVDRPEGERKLHARVVPLGGGIAVLVAASTSFLVLLLWPDARREIGQAERELTALLAAAGTLCLIGVIDDRITLRGRQKLLGQVVAAAIVVLAGLRIEQINLLNGSIELGPLAVPFTMFWLLGAINAVNLLDGADGFASTIGIIISGSIAVMAATTGHPAEAMVATVLAGAMMGFLVFNWPPAKIFLGDGGSMMIGLVIGSLAISSSLKGAATVALATPLALLAIPILDSAAAVIRRTLTGRSLYSADRGHLHHRLLATGLGPRAVIACVAVLSAATSAGALLSVYMNNEVLALVCVGAVLSILVAGRIFGYSELVLLADRTLSFCSSLLTLGVNKKNDQRVWQHSVSLQGSRNWNELWSTLTDFAEQQGLARVQLDLSISWLHEAYHAVWRRNQKLERAEAWMTRLPLSSNGRTFGRLEIAGPVNGEPIYTVIGQFSELLETLEPCIHGLAADLPRGPMEAGGEEPTLENHGHISPNQPAEGNDEKSTSSTSHLEKAEPVAESI